MTLTTIKHHWKSILFFIGFAIVAGVAIVLSSKNKTILALLKQLKFGQLDSQTKAIEEKIKTNNDKIEQIKNNTDAAKQNVEQAKNDIQKLEDQNKAFNEQIQKKKQSIDDLSAIYDALGGD